MTEDDVRLMIRKQASRSSQKELADTLGISPAYINDVVSGRRSPGAKLLNALGLERITTYRRKAKDNG